MLEAQIIRRDSDLFAGRPIENEKNLIEQLKPYLSSIEVKLLGFDPANDEGQRHSYLPSFLAGLGATASTTLLFSVAWLLATLGLPDAATVAPRLV